MPGYMCLPGGICYFSMIYNIKMLESKFTKLIRPTTLLNQVGLGPILCKIEIFTQDYNE